MVKQKNKIRKSQKRIIYILLVMLLLASASVLVYLFFILLNFKGKLVEMDDNASEIVGLVLAILGAMFGVPVGKKWWQIVYVEKGRGAFLKVKK